MESTTSSGEQAVPMFKRILKNFIEPNTISPYKDSEVDRELVDMCSKVIKDDFNSIKPKESDPKPLIGDATNQKLPSIFRSQFDFSSRDEWIDYKKKLVNALKKSAFLPDECMGMKEEEFLEGKKESDDDIKTGTKKAQEDLLKNITERLAGQPLAGNPANMQTIIPTSSLMMSAASLLSSLPNSVSNNLNSTHSGDLLSLEIESLAMLNELIGFSQKESGGLFTSGPMMNMLYAAKLALVRYFGTRSRLGGLPFNQKEKVRVFISSLGHLEMIQSVCDFLGLGTNCIVEVDTINQSFEVGEDYVTVGAEKKAVTKYLNVPTMNLVDLRTKMIECSYRGECLPLIITTMGSLGTDPEVQEQQQQEQQEMINLITETFTLDNIQGIHEVCNNVGLEFGMKVPLIYTDLTYSFPWLAFSDEYYNFKNNMLGLSEIANRILEVQQSFFKGVRMSDCCGIGPAGCSCLCMKNSMDLQLLRKFERRRIREEKLVEQSQTAKLLQYSVIPPEAVVQDAQLDEKTLETLYFDTVRSAYDPSQYAIESRPASQSIAAFVQLKTLGKLGLATLVAKVIESQLLIRDIIKTSAPNVIALVNPRDFGWTTLFRCYPFDLPRDVEEQVFEEMTNITYENHLKKHNLFQIEVYKKLVEKNILNLGLIRRTIYVSRTIPNTNVTTKKVISVICFKLVPNAPSSNLLSRDALEKMFLPLFQSIKEVTDNFQKKWKSVQKETEIAASKTVQEVFGKKIDEEEKKEEKPEDEELEEQEGRKSTEDTLYESGKPDL